jgi:hypothetical protein
MTTMAYYVALGFTRSEEEGGIVACEPKEARSADQAIRMAASLAVMEGHCGAIAFARTGDPAPGDFDDAVISATFADVDSGCYRPSGCSLSPPPVPQTIQWVAYANGRHAAADAKCLQSVSGIGWRFNPAARSRDPSRSRRYARRIVIDVVSAKEHAP